MPGQSLNDYIKILEYIQNLITKTQSDVESATYVFNTLSDIVKETGLSANSAQRQFDSLFSRISTGTQTLQRLREEMQRVTDSFLRGGVGALPPGKMGGQPLLPSVSYPQLAAQNPNVIYGGAGTYRPTNYFPTGPTIQAGPLQPQYPQLTAGKIYEGVQQSNEEFINAAKRAAEAMDDLAAAEKRVYGDSGAGTTTPVGTTTTGKGGTGKEKELIKDFEELKRLSPELTKLMDKYGLTQDNLIGATGEMTTGINRLTFAKKSDLGITQQLTVAINKHGNVLEDTQKRYRGFLSTIGRNINEAIKWSIAIKLVWGPLNKLGELVETMIDNEARLADVTVSLGESQTEINTIFKTASDVALETGTSINGVLQGYEGAIRATGGLTNENERLAASQILLRDSMVLSKLSSLEQATALDTLVGAQRQLGLNYNELGGLIDKWVAVAKRANVSVATLAESFAITSAAASSAGLDIDQLNGIIAVVAENTTLSATEAGNAVRAFISGFQTDKAQKELSNFGIAVKMSSGDALGFYDVMKQVSDLFEAGIISDAQLNKIGEAIGGGARRQAQVVATIKNLARSEEVATISAAAHGDAQAALAIKLDTVQTKLTEMSNAFQRLGQSLGVDGGVLDVLKLILNVSEGLVDSFTALSAVLGSSLPVIIATGLAMKQIMGIGGFGKTFSPGLMLSAMGGASPLQLAGGKSLDLTTGTSKLLSKMFTKTGFGVPSIMMGAGMDLIGGRPAQAAGGAAGGAIGLAIGAALGGPVAATVGANIGMAIGDSFVNHVLEFEPTFAGFFEGVFDKALKPEEKEKPETAIEKEQKALYQQALMTQGGPILGGLSVAIADAIQGAYAYIWNKQNLTREQVGISMGAGALGGVGGEYFTSRLRELYELGTAGEGGEKKIVESTQIQLAQDYASVLDDIKQKYIDQIREQRTLGEITGKQYRDSKDAIDGLSTSVTNLYAILGDLKATPTEIAQSFRELADIFVYASAEEKNAILELIGDIYYYTDLLEKVKEAGGEYTFGGITYYMKDVEEKTEDAVNELAEYVKLAGHALAMNRAVEPPVVKAEGLTEEEFDEVIKLAKERYSKFFAAAVSEGFYKGLKETDMTAAMEPFLVAIKDGTSFALAEGVRQSDFMDALQEATQMGIISGIDAGMGLMDFSQYTEAQLAAAAAQSMAISQSLKQAYPTLELNEQEFVGVVQEGFTDPMVAEMFILQLLLKDLIDVNEKQLEGVYNLPTDASFYVPFTGYALGQGTGGVGGLDLSSLLPIEQETATNTSDIAFNTAETVATLEKYLSVIPGINEGAVPDIAQKYIEDRLEAIEKPLSMIPGINEETISKAADQIAALAFSDSFEQNLISGINSIINSQVGKVHEWSEKHSYDETTPGVEATDITSSIETEGSKIVGGIYGIEGAINILNNSMLANKELMNLLITLFPSVFSPADELKGIGKSESMKEPIKLPPVETSLNINMDQTLTITLDGAVVAQQILSYMYDDLIVQEAGSSGTTKTLVI